MKHAMGLFAGVLIAVFAGYGISGYADTYLLSYGAIAIMSSLIAGTFLWLWRMRATPLALGMAFSWTGSAFVIGWWWIYTLLGRPIGMLEHPVLFVFVSFYIAGAIMHLAVIQRSFNLPQFFFVIPASAAVALSALAVIAF
ncbi:hypothetical protein LX81_01476 [Palleronia aestuarii]|uniref:Uncharacterized protein n=1 Tax=Palleronia aestuarii TaxID=568105 RepID=A0A2W7NC57_9RHOB|nr:hypothetical protein [Palleronia aestuarii]PZX17748.1 hypothetical protein LX81_01476 [Palleronia aestuarii]